MSYRHRIICLVACVRAFRDFKPAWKHHEDAAILVDRELERLDRVLFQFLYSMRTTPPEKREHETKVRAA
jgi:hypothetical protein